MSVDSLVVEACSPDSGARVRRLWRYVARDAENNVARVNRVLSYDGYEKETESETEKKKELTVTKHSERKRLQRQILKKKSCRNQRPNPKV